MPSEKSLLRKRPTPAKAGSALLNRPRNRRTSAFFHIGSRSHPEAPPISSSPPDYRWNQLQAATDYDAAAPLIHPRYVEVQDALLAALPFDQRKEFRALDLGGGSGRLAERLLDRFGYATVIVLDQSAPFVQLAHQRLRRFGVRARTLCRPMQVNPMQQDWAADLAPLDAVVSTSAIHHLERREKLRLFKRVRRVLSPWGVFINGDEHRPPADAQYLTLLRQWGEHMRWAHARGEIPESFGSVIEAWQSRNIDAFGGPRSSGDDCHETVEGQTELLRQAGFGSVEVVWNQELWAVTVAS